MQKVAEVWNLMQSSEISSAWIGAEEDGGNVAVFTKTGIEVPAEFWASDEPQFDKGSCVFIQMGQLGMNQCEIVMPFICEVNF